MTLDRLRIAFLNGAAWRSSRPDASIDEAAGEAALRYPGTKTRYTASRCRKNNEPYGPVHLTQEAEATVCGQVIDEKWTILTNDFDGEATCKWCRKETP